LQETVDSGLKKTGMIELIGNLNGRTRRKEDASRD
jgi:hypothetical protein